MGSYWRPFRKFKVTKEFFSFNVLLVMSPGRVYFINLCSLLFCLEFCGNKVVGGLNDIIFLPMMCQKIQFVSVQILWLASQCVAYPGGTK